MKAEKLAGMIAIALAMSAMAVVASALPSFAAGKYDSFRIMSFNICHCATNYTLRVTDDEVRRTAALISSVAPDFACLQEVDNKTTRSSGIDETARIAELTGMHGVFGKALDYQGGGYGVAILSKNEPLSVTTRMVEGSETRLLLICEFDDFCVATIHLDNNKTLRLESIATIREELAKLSKPVFLTGDWNATPESDTLALIKEFMVVISPEHDIVTLNSQIGVRDEYVIDYVAVDSAHREDFYVRRAWCADNRVNGIGSSDHDPVVVDVVKVPESFGWVEENAVATGRTGIWNRPVEYAAGTMKADLVGDNAFTPMVSSGGNRVTMTVTAAFDAIPLEQDTPSNTTQGAIWLGTNGCFQVWTKAGNGEQGTYPPSEASAEGGSMRGGNGWMDVAADGVTPATGVDYTFRVIFDYTSKTYSVDVKTGLTGFARLKEKNPVNPESPVQNFPLATTVTSISKVRFMGDGVFSSLLGEDVAVTGFSAAETVFLKENASVVLDAAKAKWLNSCAGGKTAVGSAAAGLSAREFADAYLLNLDITDGERSYAFEITGIEVGSENVSASVKLTRSGNLAQSINGVLKFYGAATLAAFSDSALEPLSSGMVSDDDFSDGNTATATIPLDSETPPTFFKAKIEEK